MSLGEDLARAIAAKGACADRERVGYRLRVRNDDGLHLVEQQAYYGVPDGKTEPVEA